MAPALQLLWFLILAPVGWFAILGVSRGLDAIGSAVARTREARRNRR